MDLKVLWEQNTFLKCWKAQTLTLTTMCHYACRRLSPFCKTGSYKTLLSNRSPYSSSLHCKDTRSIMRLRNFQFWNHFSSDVNIPAVVWSHSFGISHNLPCKHGRGSSSSKRLSPLGQQREMLLASPALPKEPQKAPLNKNPAALYVGGRRTHSSEWPAASISFIVYVAYVLSELSVQGWMCCWSHV